MTLVVRCGDQVNYLPQKIEFKLVCIVWMVPQVATLTGKKPANGSASVTISQFNQQYHNTMKTNAKRNTVFHNKLN